MLLQRKSYAFATILNIKQLRRCIFTAANNVGWMRAGGFFLPIFQHVNREMKHNAYFLQHSYINNV